MTSNEVVFSSKFRKSKQRKELELKGHFTLNLLCNRYIRESCRMERYFALFLRKGDMPYHLHFLFLLLPQPAL